MSKIPCKKCRSCGLYSDLSVMTCKCGEDLSKIPALLIETDDIPLEQCGVINKEVPVYVQKCSRCGAENYTADKNSPIMRCHNCNRTTVASVVPVKWFDDSSADNSETNDSLLGIPPATSDPEDSQRDWPRDSETDEPTSWSSILDGIEIVAGGPKSDITLTAIGNYTGLSFTLSANLDEPYLLGRDANQSKFLEKDERIGRKHCYLIFKDNSWYVKDNESKNGTAVNSIDIGENGEERLSDGDELKLGHHPDSMTFRISIK